MDFSSVPVHDAVVLGLEVRTVVDHFDQIIIEMEGDGFRDSLGSSKVKFTFTECYSSWMKLQMWVVGPDTVRSFQLVDPSELITELEKRNQQRLTLEAAGFKHYRLNLNTSNTTIDVIAKKVTIEPIEMDA